MSIKNPKRDNIYFFKLTRLLCNLASTYGISVIKANKTNLLFTCSQSDNSQSAGYYPDQRWPRDDAACRCRLCFGVNKIIIIIIISPVRHPQAYAFPIDLQLSQLEGTCIQREPPRSKPFILLVDVVRFTCRSVVSNGELFVHKGYVLIVHLNTMNSMNSLQVTGFLF